jgi:hypothetical protein
VALGAAGDGMPGTLNRVNDSAARSRSQQVLSRDRLHGDLVSGAGVQVLRIVLEVAETAIGREPAVERDNAQPVRIPPAIEHLEISVDDVDEDAAAHHAVEHVDRLGRVSERAVADDTSHHAPRSQAHPPHGGDWRLLKCGTGTVQRALREHFCGGDGIGFRAEFGFSCKGGLFL